MKEEEIEEEFRKLQGVFQEAYKRGASKDFVEFMDRMLEKQPGILMDEVRAAWRQRKEAFGKGELEVVTCRIRGCADCKGKGTVEITRGGLEKSKECGTCNGKGIVKVTIERLK